MKAYTRRSADTPIMHEQKGGGRRRRQRGHGRGPLRQAAGRGEGVHRLPPQRGRAARPSARRSIMPRKRASIFQLLRNPVEILGRRDNGRVTARSNACEMELGEPDALRPPPSGRRSGQRVHACDVDTVIMAIGTSPEPAHQGRRRRAWRPNKKGGLVARTRHGHDHARRRVCRRRRGDGRGQRPCLAMGAGKTAAQSIDEYIKSK